MNFKWIWIAGLAVGACSGGSSDESSTDPTADTDTVASGDASVEARSAEGVLYVFDDPFTIEESQFDFAAPAATPSADLLEGAQGAVVNVGGVDLVYDAGITCEVIDDDRMSMVADLGALRDLGPDIWFELAYDATAPYAEPNLFGVNSGAGGWVYNPGLLDFENDNMSLEWTREGNTVTGTSNAFSRSLGESQELAFVAVC